MELARMIAFSSAVGGCGVSSSAQIFARTVSRFTKKKVLLLSFDFLSLKCVGTGGPVKKLINCMSENTDIPNELYSKDYSDVTTIKLDCIVNPLHMDFKEIDDKLFNAAKNYDYVILDIPSNCIMMVDLLPRCEDIVVVYGYKEYAIKYCDNFCEFVKMLTPDSKIHKLITMYDESFKDGADEDNLFSSFASRVREIAEEIGI